MAFMNDEAILPHEQNHLLRYLKWVNFVCTMALFVRHPPLKICLATKAVEDVRQRHGSSGLSECAEGKRFNPLGCGDRAQGGGGGLQPDSGELVGAKG